MNDLLYAAVAAVSFSFVVGGLAALFDVSRQREEPLAADRRTVEILDVEQQERAVGVQHVIDVARVGFSRRRVFDVGFLADEGVIDPEDRELFWFAETANEIWTSILDWYDACGAPLGVKR